MSDTGIFVEEPVTDVVEIPADQDQLEITEQSMTVTFADGETLAVGVLEDSVHIVEIHDEPAAVIAVVEEFTEIVEIITAGAPGPPGPAGSTTVEKVAAHNVSGHRAVTTRSDGKVEYATNTDADHAGAALFLTTAAAVADDTVLVQLLGEITEPGWSWTPGPIWLAANGQLTQTPPVVPALFSRQVGAATSPTALLWQPGATYLLTT